MANSSIIDALVVTLGLDASQFEAAVGKAGASVVGLGKKFAGMFLAVEGFESLIGYLKDTNKQIAELGFNADALGVAGTELSRWGEIAHRIGGSASEAVTSVQNLQSAIFGLRFQGQMSPQLMALQRLGVPYLTAQGNPRDPQAMYEEMAARLAQQFPGDSEKWLRTQYAAQVVGQGGLARAIANGPSYVAAELKQATQDQAALTKQVIASNEEVYKQGVSLASALQSNAAAINGALAPVITKLTDEMTKLVDLVGELVHPGKAAEHALSAAWGTVSSNFMGWASGRDMLPRGIRNNNPTNLKATGNQARDAQGFAIFPTMQEGIEAAENQLDIYGSRGLNTISQIISKWAPPGKNDTAAYIKFVSGYLHKSPNAPLTGADYPTLIAAMSQLESRWKISASDVNSMLAPPNVSAAARGIISRPPPSPGVARSSGGSASSNTTSMAGGTTVNFESVVINSQAPNGSGIATDFVAAVRRKMLVANADVGLA